MYTVTRSGLSFIHGVDGGMPRGGKLAVVFFACIGNRVYTGLADHELYFTIAGSKIDEVVDQLETISNANRELERFHRARCNY